MAEDQRLRELMREYQSGRFEAFDEIYASIAPALRRYLLSQARDAAKADDLVQETFLQMHRARHTYDPSFPLMPWAMAIARHVWLMDRRTLSRRPWAPDDVTAMELPVRAEAASLADRVEVRRALGQVAPARRDAVIQHHLLGFSFKEIAERAGIAETAAKLRSSRGMAQLRALLKGPQKAQKARMTKRDEPARRAARATRRRLSAGARAALAVGARAVDPAARRGGAVRRADRFQRSHGCAAVSAGSGVWGLSIAQSAIGFARRRRGAARIGSRARLEPRCDRVVAVDADRRDRRGDAARAGRRARCCCARGWWLVGGHVLQRIGGNRAAGRRAWRASSPRAPIRRGRRSPARCSGWARA